MHAFTLSKMRQWLARVLTRTKFTFVPHEYKHSDKADLWSRYTVAETKDWRCEALSVAFCRPARYEEHSRQ
jgi:hypothetical protein